MDRDMIINLENYRTLDRVKDLGEVFTPDQYVQQMLSLFDSKIWSNENIVFFEPTAGHGNIVLAILDKRVSALLSKYSKSKLDKPMLHAVANALDSLWAIDICPLNIELMRKRVFALATTRILASNCTLHDKKMRNYLAHVLCAIAWQIHENEALSALSRDTTQTKQGSSWLRKNSRKPLNFRESWCSFFAKQEKCGAIPEQFLRALRFIDLALTKSSHRGFEEFEFAKDALQMFKGQTNSAQKSEGAA